jgi:hypothetical protein
MQVASVDNGYMFKTSNGIYFANLPLQTQTFFQKLDTKCLLPSQFLQASIGFLMPFYFILSCVSEGIPFETGLSSLHEGLQPRIINGCGNSLTSAKIRDQELLAESFQHYPDLVLGRDPLADLAANLSDESLSTARGSSPF